MCVCEADFKKQWLQTTAQTYAMNLQTLKWLLESRDQVCDHSQSAAVLKETLLDQDVDKAALRWN